MKAHLYKIRLYQRITHHLYQTNTVAGANWRTARNIAQSLGRPTGTVRALLKDLLKASVVISELRGSDRQRFLTRMVDNKNTELAFEDDVAAIQSLARKHPRVAKIVQNLDPSTLNVNDNSDREIFNGIVVEIQKLGLGSQLGTYQLKRRAIRWGLAPQWRTKLEAFIHPQQSHF